MLVLLGVIVWILWYVFASFLSNDASGVETVIPTTSPITSEQPVAPSEPTGIPMRLVYIVSVLVVFVSAVLLLFRMLLKVLIKDTS